jgi:hypothetical protein
VNPTDVAVLSDERDLVWLVIGSVRPLGSELSFDVQFASRDEPDDTPQPFISGVGYREPESGLRSLVEALAGVVLGDIRALRHDPVRDGLSFEIKVEGEGDQRSLEVVLWLDLTRTSRAMKAWGTRGRQRSGLRFHTTVDKLEQFRSDLDRLAFPAAEA